MKRGQERSGDLCDNFKQSNIHTIEASEREDREKGAVNLFEEVVAENIPKLGK